MTKPDLKDPNWIRYVWIALGICVPLSVKVYFPFIGLELIFPAEPLVAILFSYYCWQLISHGPELSLRSVSLKDPLFILASSWLLIYLYSALFSSMTMVSLKAMAVQIAYVFILVFIPLSSGTSGRLNTELAMRWHDRAFLLIALFTMIALSVSGFDRIGANFSSFPFYMDHTIFSAALTFVFFRYSTRCWHELKFGDSMSRKAALIVIVLGLFTVLIMIHGRAAWLAVLGTMILAAIFRMGLSTRGLIIGATITVLAFFTFQTPLLNLVRKNQVNSHAHDTGIRETALSIWNITTDASNRERLLRWTSALRMFEERPWTGVGPGAYQYFHFEKLTSDEIQRSSSAPLISDQDVIPAWSAGNALMIRNSAEYSPSNGGTAHSEYLLALSERGILGGLWWLIAAVVILHKSGKIFNRNGAISLWEGRDFAAFALTAYLIHAVVNNFLDDMKVAMLFWIALGWLLHTPGSPGSADLVKPRS